MPPLAPGLAARSAAPMLFALALVALAPGSTMGQTSYPMLTRIDPVAVTRGTTAEVSIVAVQDIGDATGLLFEGSGLSAEVIPPAPVPEADAQARTKGEPKPSVRPLRAKLTVAADAIPGPRECRVVTPRGVSSIGMLLVVADPVVTEGDDKANDDPQGAVLVPVPAVACGTVGKTEDVDWYRFHAEAGQTLTLSLWGNRLENKIHDLQTHLDPLIVLHDEAGRELLIGDNEARADPHVVHTFSSSGTYRVEVRDATYAGNPHWSYALHLNPGPSVMTVFPLAVNPGSTATLSALGVNFDTAKPLAVPIPADAKPGPLSLPLPTDGGEAPPVPLVVTPWPLAVEPDDAPAESATAPTLAFPSATSGRLAVANDVDVYRFEAKKGDARVFEVYARRVGSQADPVLRILDAEGKELATADDTFGKDPRLEWTAPADGTFAVAVRDLHSRGGPGFPYALLSAPTEPDFTLTCDPDKLNVGPGARTALYVKLQRRMGFDGPVALQLDGLPAGLSASPLTIAPGLTQGVIVVTAAADAKPAATQPRLTGRGEGLKGPIEVVATPRQEIYMPGGGRGLYSVETLAAAVTEPSDITVEATPATLALAPGQSASIQVTIQRREGFKGPVNLALDLAHLGTVYASPLPPGVKLKAAGSKTLIGPNETTATLVLEAAPDAKPCTAVPITVQGHVSINFVVKTAYCSAPIALTVPAKP